MEAQRGKSSRRIVIAAMLGALACGVSAAQAVPVDFRWVQTGCDGESCAATVSGRWTFTEEAVERGYVFYYTRRELFPDDAPDGVEKFSFTVGRFVLDGYNRPPLTWTNDDATDGAARYGRSAHYVVTFSDDRQSIVAIAQPRTPEWSYGGLYSTTFEKYVETPTLPSVRITVWPDAIEYVHLTFEEYGQPHNPGPTIFTGEWRVVTPISAPGSLALVGAALVAAGLTSGGVRWRRASV